jgi:hypothetical protein
VNNQFGYVNTEKVKSNDNTLISWQFKASGAKRYTLQVIYESDNPISSYNIIMTKKRNGMVVDEREEIVDPVDPIESDNNQPWGPYQPNKPVVEVNYNQAAILEELEDKGWRAVACNPAMTSRIVFSPNQIICLQPQLEVGQTYYYDFNTNKIVITQPQYINWPNNNGWDNNNRWQNNNSWPNNNGW